MLPTSFFANQKNLWVRVFRNELLGVVEHQPVVSFRDGDLQPEICHGWKAEFYKAKLPMSADALLVPRCRVCHGEDCFVLGAAYYQLGINIYFLAALEPLESPIDVKITLWLCCICHPEDILTSFLHALNLRRNLLSWNLTRALRWKVRCLVSTANPLTNQTLCGGR